MRTSIKGFSALFLVALSTPAFAQEEADSSGISVSGSATIVSDYRFRGVSQSSEEAAIQGGFTVNHDSGLYAGTWGSSISFSGGTEIDFFGGYATEVTPGVTLDVGATYYWYPGGTGATDVIEPYVAVSGDLGPVSTKVGFAYAPDQKSLGDASAVYLYTDMSTAIPSTPLKLNGHIGFAKSDSFLGGPDGNAIDYSIGVSASYKALTLGVSYVNTDYTNRGGAKEALGADGAVLFSLGASF
ncbi:TorF family putative porin [Sphingomonas sp. C3-2]|uniref:TorF family putative porin n=1 Tax=Sphingomonas sp. C3-2 TaxID=3062169 RepID=UPI00294B6CB4|nr:TorF family putative porin [Sphingomonas sp. C3-2]WOK35802.1 TorF family putative porin [Sphingomonas sp. C3-2]